MMCVMVEVRILASKNSPGSGIDLIIKTEKENIEIFAVKLKTKQINKT